MPGSNPSLSSPSLPTIPSIELPPAPDPTEDRPAYLRSIYAVRARSKLILEAALKNQLNNFNVDMSKFSDVAEYVVSIIKVFRHFLQLYNCSPDSNIDHELHSGTTKTSLRFRPTAAGNILKSEAFPVSMR